MKIKMNKKGFTLIELLIVIAIIAILAAIAIPQFSAYRIRGFNASAESDCRNFKLTQEAMNSTFASYGHVFNAILPGPGGFALGAPQMGAIGGASTTGAGAGLTTTWVPQRVPAVITQFGGLGIGIGSNVEVDASNVVSATDPNVADTGRVQCKHREGDMEFATVTDTTAIYWCKNPIWVKLPIFSATAYAPVLNTDPYLSAACAGAPDVTWRPL